MTKRTAYLKWVALALALACFGLAFTSFRYFLSEMHSFQGKRYERFWESRGQVESARQWQRARQHMERAYFYNNRNPDMLLRYARILEWYSFTPEPDGERIRENLANAHDLLENAAELRPNHGFTYASSALLKARRWLVDDSLTEDLVKAAELAPWERSSRLKIAYAAAVTWPELDDRGREVFLDQIAAADSAESPLALRYMAIAEEFARKPEICTKLEKGVYNGRVVEFCQD